MMANPYRGEVGLTVNGEVHILRLSLGDLAVLEGRMGAESLPELVERFETGAFKARDILLLLSAGLGWSLEDLMDAEIEGGPMAAAKTAAALLRVTFELPEAAASEQD